MSREVKNRIEIRYGRLVVKEFIGTDWNGHHWVALWLCKCDCGNEKIVSGNHLQNGGTKSCGCLQREIISKRSEKYTGKNNPRYIHGFRCNKATKEILELKKKRRKQDNYTCQDCGIIQKEYKKKNNRILDVHHIDRDDTNNTMENLITYCRNCHRKNEGKYSHDTII